MRRRIGHLGMGVFYLVAGAGLGFFAWVLQHPVYHPPPPPGQMYAVVFVRDPAARVSLSADIYPGQPWNDSLTVAVAHVPRAQAGWVLVIECPRGMNRPPVVHFSEAGPQTQPSVTLATVDTGMVSPGRKIMFGCFPKSSAGVSGSSPSLANVSVAALQLDDGMVGAPALPVLYARQNSSGGRVSQLVQVLANVSCPSATPTPVSTTSSSTPIPASPSVVATPSPSDEPTAPVPSTAPSSSVPQPTTPASPGCLGLAPAEAKFIQYQLPSGHGSEFTSETLHDVDYKNYQLSMYPTGDTPAEDNGDESIIWKASSAEDPNFGATNDTAQLNGQRDLFISGIIWGIVGGAVVAGVDHFYEAHKERKEKLPYRHIPL